MLDRSKGIALAHKFGAPKTAKIIETACHERIFKTAIEEIGQARFVEALVEAKDAEWAYYALRDVPNLTEAQRSELKRVAHKAA